VELLDFFELQLGVYALVDLEKLKYFDPDSVDIDMSHHPLELLGRDIDSPMGHHNVSFPFDKSLRGVSLLLYHRAFHIWSLNPD
jgi:hypothetical protein